MLYYITGVKVRVYCEVGKARQGKFALHVAVKTLELYKEYVSTIIKFSGITDCCTVFILKTQKLL